jgi:hypothetical protein
MCTKVVIKQMHTLVPGSVIKNSWNNKIISKCLVYLTMKFGRRNKYMYVEYFQE